MAAEYPSDLKYTKDHEWARKTGTAVQVGVTWHAQDAIGAVAYVELPKVGITVTAGGTFGVIESTKATSDLFAPVAGKITKVNDALTSNPGLINDDPYRSGWLVEIEPASSSEFDALLDSATYTKLLGA